MESALLVSLAALRSGEKGHTVRLGLAALVLEGPDRKPPVPTEVGKCESDRRSPRDAKTMLPIPSVEVPSHYPFGFAGSKSSVLREGPCGSNPSAPRVPATTSLRY